jgi:hypothetical protein
MGRGDSGGLVSLNGPGGPVTVPASAEWLLGVESPISAPASRTVSGPLHMAIESFRDKRRLRRAG